ncbi:B12-binding domain-containing radical SAM protein [Nocardia sp. NPDC088792]|uniref:B12-binding domain-containing radical SAM protein n=1 Tax=Nocardia sp. NPDC088792 TaxID=3364332 RepID=UPI0037F6ADF8
MPDPRSPRILVIWPPQVLSYFNAGHHLALYQVTGHLRNMLPHAEVRVLDATVERCTWKDIGDDLFQRQYDVIAIMNDFDGVDGIRRFLGYARALSPASKVVTFGRLSGMNPGFFQRYDLDAIVHNGDFEPGVYAATGAFLGLESADTSTLYLRGDGGWTPPARSGDVLDPQDWVLPDPAEIPYHRYDEMYGNDANKFCGIPKRRELVVPAARGCPIGCSYCEVHPIFGKRERRLSVDRTLDYIERSFAAAPFEYVAFYAPTFTLDRKWVRELCDRLIAGGARYPWKCATTMHHLDRELVERMGRSGCVRISVGLETLEPAGHDALPRAKHRTDADLDRLSQWCAEAGVELNCFVIVGLPGTSVDGARHTIATVHRLHGRARPTVYCPTERMTPEMTEAEMGSYNRQLFVADSHGFTPEELHAAYELVFGHQPDQTTVFQHIPTHESARTSA